MTIVPTKPPYRSVEIYVRIQVPERFTDRQVTDSIRKAVRTLRSGIFCWRPGAKVKPLQHEINMRIRNAKGS